MTRALLEHGAHISDTTQYGETVLYLAAASHDPQGVRLLLERGCDPNLGWTGTPKIAWMTPMHIATDQQDLATVSVLREYGARTDETQN